MKSFALAGILPDISGGQDHAIVLFEYKYSVFQNEMNDVKMGETGFAAIVSPDHRMVYDPNEELVGSGSKVAVNLDQAQYSDIVVDPSGESQLVVYQQSSKTGWYTLGSVPMNELLAETKKNLRNNGFDDIDCGIGGLRHRVSGCSDHCPSVGRTPKPDEGRGTGKSCRSLYSEQPG